VVVRKRGLMLMSPSTERAMYEACISLLEHAKNCSIYLRIEGSK
jgi:hypothetical protein